MSCLLSCPQCSTIRVNITWGDGLDLLIFVVALHPNEAVTVQLQRVQIALALEEARKIAPLG